MSFPEYGEIIQPARERGTFEEYGEIVQPISRARSLVNAPAKGAVKRAGDIAEFFQSVAPFMPKGPLNREKAHEFAEEKFPVFEKEPEKYLERAGGVATEALISPGGLTAKAIQIPLGAGLGYLAEKAKLPEWVQSLAEGLPFFYKGGKKIPLKPDQKRLGEFMRNQGLTEKEITPLLKTPEQIERWTKYMKKGKKNRDLMNSIYVKTGHLYDNIINEAKNTRPLSVAEKTDLLNEMGKIVQGMPNEYRKLIAQDMKDFLTKGRAGIEDIINLDKDINTIIGAERGGRAIIGQFKGPLQKAISSIDPKLADDYSLAKELYATRAKVAVNVLSKKDIDKIIDMGEVMTLSAGIGNRDAGLITKAVGVALGRTIARKMIFSPRLQNISTRILEALKKNKYMIAEKYTREFMDIVNADEKSIETDQSKE